MKIGKAHCPELDIDLTIYQLRDWHFDEDEYNDINADNLTFLCQDINCRAELSDVNATNPKPKQTPHFRTLTNETHSCGIEDDDKLTIPGTDEPKRGHDKAYKENEFPDEFLLKRKPSKRRGTPEDKPEQPIIIENPNSSKPKNDSDSRQAPNRTSDLEHIVECFLGHQDNPETLKHKYLTIDKQRLSYRRFFVPVGYYDGREELRIYYGQLKTINVYGEDKDQRFVLKFKAWPTLEDKKHPLSIYLSKNTINSYRKRKLFKTQMLNFLEHPEQDVLCFFFGYPELVDKNYKNKEGTYKRLEATVTNLDHLVLCFN